MEQKMWGWLTAISAAGCNNKKIQDTELFQTFIDEVLEKIQMVKIDDLQIRWCDTHDPLKAGHSLYQLLQDSNISIHFCPTNGDLAFVDLFSCKPYDALVVVELFEKYFEPQVLEYFVLERPILELPNK